MPGLERDLDDWAAANGLKIVSMEPGTYTSSRVLFSTRSAQEFRVTVRDRAGAVKSGQARLVRTGMRAVDVDIHWDD